MSLYGRVIQKALQHAYNRAKGFCRSRQLRRELFFRVVEQSKVFARGFVRSPQYWAVYYHSKRATIFPRTASKLIWFRNPKDDPRLINGESPMYESQVRRLTKEEFRYWSKQNQRARDSGRPVPMIVADRSPFRSIGVQHLGNPYLSDAPDGGLWDIDKDVGRIAAQEAYEEMEQMLRKSGLKDKKIVRYM